MQNLKPIVKVSIKDLKSTIDSIFMFFEDDQIINMIHAQKVAKDFNLNIDFLKTMSIKKRYNYIEEKITPLYNKKINELANVVKTYQNFWNENQTKIHNTFKDIFELEYVGERICNCYVSINSVCPRYYEDWSFDNSYTKSKELFMDNTVHELIHFFWFDLWKIVFPNYSKNDFSAPSLGWAISELVIDAIAKCTDLKNYTREKSAYGYVYEIEYKNKNLMDIMKEMFFDSKDIKEFMKNTFDFLIKNPELQKLIIR